jgi:hypothetical protein
MDRLQHAFVRVLKRKKRVIVGNQWVCLFAHKHCTHTDWWMSAHTQNTVWDIGNKILTFWWIPTRAEVVKGTSYVVFAPSCHHAVIHLILEIDGPCENVMRRRRMGVMGYARTSADWQGYVFIYFPFYTGCVNLAVKQIKTRNEFYACGWKQIHKFTENCAPALMTSILKIREKSVHSQTQKPLMLVC